jgi:hypothetical protein
MATRYQESLVNRNYMAKPSNEYPSYVNPITGKTEYINFDTVGGADGYYFNNLFRRGTANEVAAAVKHIMETGNYDEDKIKQALKKAGFNSKSGTKLDTIIEDAKTYINKLGYNTEDITNAILEKEAEGTSGYDSGLDYYKQLIEDSLATNKNSEFAKQYQADMYSNINSYEQATNATLASAELDAYRMLGQQQLQLENQIASERMQALKAGTTSAQLASRELANMFAAQSSAQQIAQNVLGRRADTANTFNQQRAGVVDSMYNMLANNQTTAANAYAQLGAAQASYNSYMQQPYASYDALMSYYKKDPQAILKATGMDK